MHMLSKTYLSSDELDILRRSRNPSVVLAGNGDVHTNEKRVSVEEQRAQKHDQFLRRRQIAHMICECFRATKAFKSNKDSQFFFSLSVCRMTTSKISTSDGIMHCYQ